MQPKDVVQALLDRGKAFRPAGDLESQALVKGQAGIEVAHHQRAVVDTLEEFGGIDWTLTGEFCQLEGVAVGISEVEKGAPIGKPLRPWRDELHAVGAQACGRPLDVRHHQGEVLEPGVVAARVSRDSASLRGNELRQLDLVWPQGEAHDPYARPKYAHQTVIAGVSELDVEA